MNRNQETRLRLLESVAGSTRRYFLFDESGWRSRSSRLADEYDAAQERGEVASGRDGPGAGVLNGNAKATAEDIGLTRKAIHDAGALD